MFLSIDNPVYNTIIVFSLIMLILYFTKPNAIYDDDKKEFRQFGTTNGKTLLPIYVIGILLAIILYVFFYYISKSKSERIPEHKIVYNLDSNNNGNAIESRYANNEYYLNHKLQYIQNQMDFLLKNQIIHDQLLYDQLKIKLDEMLHNEIKKQCDFGTMLPNSLNI